MMEWRAKIDKKEGIDLLEWTLVFEFKEMCNSTPTLCTPLLPDDRIGLEKGASWPIQPSISAGFAVILYCSLSVC